MEPIFIQKGNWQAHIAPAFGMNVISLRHQGEKILREPASFEALAASPYLHGIPLLLPANRTKGGLFCFEGREYRLPLNEPAFGNHLHGLMFDAPFTPVETAEDHITAIYENEGERYPFPFRMTVCDSLTDIGFSRRVIIENTGRGPMPYTLAFHTTFAEPDTFSVPVGERFICDENHIPTGEMAPLTEAQQLYRAGSAARGQAVSGFYKAQAHTAHIGPYLFSVSENFDEWVLYNAGGDKGFLCIEPQCGEVNGLNRPQGHRVLAPGSTDAFSLSITKEEQK